MLHPMLNTAVTAARRAGAIINRAASDVERITAHEKSLNDFVSEVDRAAEDAAISILRKAYPGHSILAEESGESGGSATEYQWIIDPLDGTTNFLHGFPHYAVSIALRQRGVITQGVIYDPVRNELFTATRGAGAYLNDRRLRVSRRTTMKGAMLGTGFPFRQNDHLDAYLRMLRELMPRCAGVRRAGAASLDLAYVAAARLDGFWELGLSVWDIAAGALLIAEAGGIVAGIDGEATHLDSGHVVAATPKLFPLLLAALAPHVPAELRGARTN